MLHEVERSFKSKDGHDGRLCFPPVWMAYPMAEYYSGLSRTTLWRLVKSGEIDAMNYGRAVRLSRDSIDAFMRSKVAA